MELTSQMKTVQIRKSNPLDESRKTGQTSGTKMAFYSRKYFGFKRVRADTQPRICISNGYMRKIVLI
ncbi:hypothetical protein Hanom_Chr08g00694451 [Helianthus anomalus]